MGLDGMNWPLLTQQIGLGALLGLAAGYTAKKALKLAFVVLAVLLLALLTMQNYDLIHINWHIIEAAYQSAFDHPGGIVGMFTDWAGRLDTVLPVAGSFVVGFLFGLRMG